MADNTYSNANAIAKIKLIYPFDTNSIPKVVNQQAAYDNWMLSGGGKPDVFGSPALYSSNQFEVIVTRFDSSEFVQTGIFKKYLRAWVGMPLFAGDIIEGGPNLCATVDFLSGGRFFVLSRAVWKLNGEGDATNLHPPPLKGVWAKFTKDEPFRFNPRAAGTTMSIKG